MTGGWKKQGSLRSGESAKKEDGKQAVLTRTLFVSYKRPQSRMLGVQTRVCLRRQSPLSEKPDEA